MSDALLFQVESGAFALKLVDKAAPGYSESWQTPGGVDITDITMADYTNGQTGADAWQCQVTSGALTPRPNSNTITVPATWCSPSREVIQPGQTGYDLELAYLQDPQVGPGLSAFLFAHDTEEAYFLLGLNPDPGPPKVVGRLKLVAGAIGGEARANLTAEVTWSLTRKPDIWFGESVDDPNAEVVYGSGQPPTPAKGNAAPGTVYPAEATITASDATNAAKLTGLGYVANPATAWTTGQKITVGTYDFHWSGSAWAAGAAT